MDDLDNWRRSRRRKLIAGALLTALVALAFIVNAVLPLRIIKAYFKSKSEFTQCTSDVRVWCEPGAQVLGKAVARDIDAAIATVLRRQFSPISEPVVIYAYATKASFLAHTGFDSPQAMVANGVVHVSPTALRDPIKPLLIHEMSHLAMYQSIGVWAMAGLPVWFLEGLATYVSDGAGAGQVTEEGAVRRMAEGACMTPSLEQPRWKPLARIPARVGTAMFYRQAAMFVEYLAQADPRAFQRLVDGVRRKTDFAQAVTQAYGVPLAMLWTRFLDHERLIFKQRHAQRLGPLCVAS